MMSTKHTDPNFDTLVLDDYEQEIEDALDVKLLSATPTKENEELIVKLQEWARRNHAKKVTIQSEVGLIEDLKKVSRKLNIPYSHIINNLVKQFLRGRIDLK